MVELDLLSKVATSSKVSNRLSCLCPVLPSTFSTLSASCPTFSISMETACGSSSNVMLSIYLSPCFILCGSLFHRYLFGSLALQVVHHARIDLCGCHIAVREHLRYGVEVCPGGKLQGRVGVPKSVKCEVL